MRRKHAHRTMAEGCLSPTIQTNQQGKVKHRMGTYWVQGLSAADQWEMFGEKGWHKVDLEEGRAPFFSRYRRTCKLSLVKQAQVRPFPYATCLSHCCDKKQFYTSMTTAGYSRSIPETYTSYEALRKSHVRDRPSTGEVWYVKTSDGCHGRGVQVFDDFRELKTHVRSLLNEPYVIQRGVSQLSLVDGKKWTIRTHVLITPDLQLYTYNDGVCIIHSEQYKEGSLERAAQILHNSKATRYGLLNGPVAHLMPEVMPQVRKISFEVCDSIRPKLLKYKGASPSHYALMGLDFILDSSHVVHCLEVNEFPQLDFSGDPEAHEVVTSTFKDFLSLVVFPRMSASCGIIPEHGGWELLPQQLDLSTEEALSTPGLQEIRHKRYMPHSTDTEKKMFMEKELKLVRRKEPDRRREREPKERVLSPPVSPDVVLSPPLSPTQEVGEGLESAKVVLPSSLQEKQLAVPSPPQVGLQKVCGQKRQVLKMHRVGMRVAGQTQAAGSACNDVRSIPFSSQRAAQTGNPWSVPLYSHLGSTRGTAVLHGIENGTSCKIRRPLKYR